MEQAGKGDALLTYDKICVWTTLGVSFEWLGVFNIPYKKYPVIKAHRDHVTTVASRERVPGYASFHLQSLKTPHIVSNFNGSEQESRSAYKVWKKKKWAYVPPNSG